MPDIFIPPASPSDPPVPVEPDPATVAKNDAVLNLGKVGVFSSFISNPAGVSFQGQDPSEVILLFLRRHFITNIPWIFISLVLLVLPLVLQIIFAATGIDITFSYLPQRYITFFTFFYYLVVAIYIYISFITWYYNISLVTNIRVVDLDFSEVVYKNVAETKVTQIEDTSFSQTGAIRTFFDYGDVMVQTSAAIDHFDFSAVPHPARVVNIIEELIGNT